MGSVFETMADKLPAIVGAAAAILFVGIGYFFITLDRQRATSTSKDDTQVGLKLVLYGLVLAGVQLASQGLTSLVAFIFGGFKGGSMPIRMALPPIIVGAAIVAVIVKLLLPRTNAALHRQPERMLLGALGIQFGVMGLIGVSGLVNGVFLDAPWAYTSQSLATTIVCGAITFLAITRLGTFSGWITPVPVAPPMTYPPQAPQPPQAPPQQGGGYPPQGGSGYGPQGGGYPPQGGGYPPQGGGYPPQGGGYPPQGGGFPPQGGSGGGFPPQGGGGGGAPGGGGGYPPR